MANNSITMFTNDSGVAGGPIAFVQDAFQDITNFPSTNAGWSSTAASNPLNYQFGDDDFPRYGAKTLWIKDLNLLPDRSLWVQGKPTYEIIWNEPYPAAKGYLFGDITLQKTGWPNERVAFQILTSDDGFGVTGVFRRAMFLLKPTVNSNVTSSIQVDGVATTTTRNYGDLATDSVNAATTRYYVANVSAQSNDPYNIHDYRVVNTGGDSLIVYGVVVYSENPSLSIDQFPGTTYNDKTQAKTTVNTTLPLPAWGASTGGVATIWKNSNAGYSLSTLQTPTVVTSAVGSSGTNILNITTGHGSSFSSGNGIIAYFGSSPYIGIIQTVSTDALTVFPTLPIGISGSLYRHFQAGQSLTINSTLNMLAYTFGATEISRMGNLALGSNGGLGTTTPYLDPYQNFAVWGTNLGITINISTNIALDQSFNPVLQFTTPSGFIQCEGYFSAAEIEWRTINGSSSGATTTNATISGTMMVNGLPAYSHNNLPLFNTSSIKKSVFTSAGPGWNSFAFYPGSSHNAMIGRINLYQRQYDQSATFGLLGSFETLQSFVNGSNNGTMLAPGVFRRHFGDQLLFKGPWVRALGGTLPGGMAYFGSTTTCSLFFEYYGTNFSLVGGSFGVGASFILSLDGSANLGATSLNTVVQSTLAFHSVSLGVLGGTAIISAIDVFRTYGEMKNIQTWSPVPGATTILDLQKLEEDTAVVACQVRGNPPTGGTARNPIVYPTVIYDTTFGYIPSTGNFVAKYPGYYELIGRFNLSSAAALFVGVVAGSGGGLGSGGTYALTTTVSNTGVNASAQFPMRAGDSCYVAATTDVSAAFNGGDIIYIKKLTGRV